MKFLRTAVEVTNIGHAKNGTITCEITVYYKSTVGAPVGSAKAKKAIHVFNISELIKEWEKWSNTFVRVVEKPLTNASVSMSQDGSNWGLRFDL